MILPKKWINLFALRLFYNMLNNYNEESDGNI